MGYDRLCEPCAIELEVENEEGSEDLYGGPDEDDDEFDNYHH
jgi:hypothetical protein